MAAGPNPNPEPGLRFQRFFTREGLHPFDAVTFERREARITSPTGEVVFEMRDVEVPIEWSQLATDILASKYFRKLGVPGSGSETSLKQVLNRITTTIRQQGEVVGLFASPEDANSFESELTHLLLHQMGAFNSPVWFNCGLWHQYGIAGSGGSWFWNLQTRQIESTANAYQHPQCSACFIQSVDDDLMGLFELMKTEARLFKYGSGTGTNFSRIRGKQEKLSGGGYSSGLLSFLEVLDRGAGATKSGGTTRRAAKMVCLDMDHPEIVDFIHWKRKEELKVQALIQAGYSGDFNGEAYQTVAGQNSNNSVRLNNRFMQAYLNDEPWQTTLRTTGEVCETFQARDLMRQIAECAWACADPGVQFDDVINEWHTCSTGGRIRGSNPCSEFHFLDDTACNLASLNLLKFVQPDGQFDTPAFRQACRVFFTAQELLVDLASYPTARIAQNSHDYRPLGLGYANLGALLMRWGLPYDSPESYAITGAITALMTGEAYRTSAELAGRLGAFPAFPENQQSMLTVMRKHQAALADIQPDHCPTDLLAEAVSVWDEVLTLGQRYGYRNAQATVLAPTGTIGLLMDCDTTGIEPDFALIKWKKLSGGGTLKMVNHGVAQALQGLGYTEAQQQAIVAYVDQTGTVEGAPGLQEAHYAIFDCATASGQGTRFIAPMAHIHMMAAAQPFLSGAISKTVNLPHSATVEDIEALYVTAWRLGLKGVALYRDGCKFSQPLSTQPLSSQASTLPSTESLQAEQPITVAVAGQALRLQAQTFSDHRLAAIRIEGIFTDETVKALLQCWLYAVSLALQAGVPLTRFVEAYAFTAFGPAGLTDHPHVRQCSSLVDLITRILGVAYLGRFELAQAPPSGAEAQRILSRLPQAELVSPHAGTSAPDSSLAHLWAEAPPCSQCGNPTLRDGACYRCHNCGHSQGCA
ncbi:vitamin B12-dependent ribonucleotide reductase [Vampirovibrio chlorellavorus]|uniref:vitamin B12-dependent ribonucleotide reductase n=1 Tax=Vampirovibrio chlorellavorus TaxID=758823 RepID=UPI0026ED43A1|nr:vitamin B12-dependent ribonucleotide reductase [Vampirovibrio chlorellavorus]